MFGDWTYRGVHEKGLLNKHLSIYISLHSIVKISSKNIHRYMIWDSVKNKFCRINEKKNITIIISIFGRVAWMKEIKWRFNTNWLHLYRGKNKWYTIAFQKQIKVQVVFFLACIINHNLQNNLQISEIAGLHAKKESSKLVFIIKI